MQPYEASPKVTQRDMAHCGTVAQCRMSHGNGGSWISPVNCGRKVDIVARSACHWFANDSRLWMRNRSCSSKWLFGTWYAPDSETESSFGFSVANMEINWWQNDESTTHSQNCETVLLVNYAFISSWNDFIDLNWDEGNSMRATVLEVWLQWLRRVWQLLLIRKLYSVLQTYVYIL